MTKKGKSRRANKDAHNSEKNGGLSEKQVREKERSEGRERQSQMEERVSTLFKLQEKGRIKEILTKKFNLF